MGAVSQGSILRPEAGGARGGQASQRLFFPGKVGHGGSETLLSPACVFGRSSRAKQSGGAVTWTLIWGPGHGQNSGRPHFSARAWAPVWSGWDRPRNGRSPKCTEYLPCLARAHWGRLSQRKVHLSLPLPGSQEQGSPGQLLGKRAAGASASVAETTVPSGPQGLQAWTAGGASCGTSPQPAGHGHFALQKSEPAFTRDRSSPQRDAKPVSSRLSFSSDAAAGCDKGA